MVGFYVLLFVPLIIQHFAVTQTRVNCEKKNKNALAFFFFFFTVLVMLRHESVGNDTANYIYFFNNFSEMPWSEVGKYHLETGFSYFNKIISVFTDNPQIYLMVTAIVTSLLIYSTYKRFYIDPSLTIVIFCAMSTFVMAFSGIRQMLAIGLGFVAYEFARKRKPLWFILIVILAVSFHTSAFMLLFMYPLYHLKITKKSLVAVVPILTLVFVFNRQIFSFLTAFINRFTRFEGGITSTGAYTMLLMFLLFAVFSFVVPDEALVDEETAGLRNFLLFALAVQMFAPLHTLAMRMNYYYIIFIPLLMPKIISFRSERYKQIAVAARHIMVVFFLIYFFANAYRGGALHVFPYHSFWEVV